MVHIICNRFDNYLNRFGKCFKKELTKTRTEKQNCIEKLKARLESEKITLAASFIDRRTAERSRVCDEKGAIICQGVFEKGVPEKRPRCIHKHHTVNPYGTSTSLLVFRNSYNLDHTIAIKNIAESARKVIDENGTLNIEKIFELLFRPNNLKFVHVHCHKHNERKYLNQDGTDLILEELLFAS